MGKTFKDSQHYKKAGEYKSKKKVKRHKMDPYQRDDRRKNSEYTQSY